MGGEVSRRIALLTVAVAVTVSGLMVCACGGSGPVERAAPATLRFAVSEECLSSLVFVAEGIGAFEERGLEVEIVPFPSSLLAYEALLAGDVDAATVADTPLALKGVADRQPRVIATIGRSDSDIKLIANAAQGVRSPADLPGARIATRKDTAAHFFLHAYLASHGIAETEVELEFTDFGSATEMLVSGEVDAVAVREPFIGIALEALADDALLLEAPGLYGKTMNVVVVPSVSSVTRVKLMEALIAAEESAADASCDGIAEIVSAWLALEPDQMCEVICGDGLSVRLDQSLILQLEDQARWALSHDSREDDAPTDYLEMLDVEPLATVDAARVPVIR